MLWLTEAARVLLEIADTDIASPSSEQFVPDGWRRGAGCEPGRPSFIAGNSAYIRHDPCQTQTRRTRTECVHFTAVRDKRADHAALNRQNRQKMPRSGTANPAQSAHALPLFLFRQYDELHELFRNDLLILFGPRHLWAQEVAGDRTPDRQVHERVQAGLQRIQGANRAGDFAPGG